MKSKVLLLIVVMAALFSSCLVISLHPFYDNDSIYFDEKLTGHWLDQDSTWWYIKQILFRYGDGNNKKEFKKNGYVIGHENRDGTLESFDVFLFKINDQLYADFTPSIYPTSEAPIHERKKLENIHLQETHSLAKVIIKSDKNIEIQWFNSEWLANLIESNRIKISHEFIEFQEPFNTKVKGKYILTASTDELQKFISKYGDAPEAFIESKEEINMKDYFWHAGNGKYSSKFDNNPIIGIPLNLKLRKVK